MPGYKVVLQDGEEIRDGLICPYCKLLVKEPVQTSESGVRLCRECFVVASKDPSFAAELDPNDQIWPDAAAKKEIANQLKVKCENYIIGCDWKGLFKQLMQHSQECQYVTVECRNPGCGQQVLKARMEVHLKEECPQRHVSCKDCGKEMYFIELQDHIEVCPYGTMKYKRIQEIEATMLKARDAKYSIPLRYGKVLFCGASAAGKSNFLKLLMEEDFQSLHISTEVLKPQQVTVAMKAVISESDDDKVEFKKMNIDDEILQLESYLPEKYASFTSSTSTLTNNGNIQAVPMRDIKLEIEKVDNNTEKVKPESSNTELEDDNNKLALANVSLQAKKLNKQPLGRTWDILTFMDTGGQPQFISMLPAVNSFAMITFIIHKMESGGQKSLNEIVKVQYGNEKGETSFQAHPHKYTYLQLIETLISYASNVLLPDTKFLDKLKVESKEIENVRSILLVGTHSGDDKLPENHIKDIDNELTKVVEKSGVNHIKPSLNKNYESLVPVDNKIQGKHSRIQEDTKRYTKPSAIRSYIQKFLNNQDVIYVPIKWLLLELEIRKVCLEKNCNLISYSDVLKLAKEKKLDYNGEFGDDVDIEGDQFIKQGLRFHHSFGVLLYFEEIESMQKLVITNHQWLFNKLSKIVKYSFTCDTREEYIDLRKGIFKKTLLGSDCLDVSKDFKDSQIDTKLLDPMNAFLKLLEHLLIAAPINETADKYFMPCLLDSSKLIDLKRKESTSYVEPLLIQFKSEDNKTCAFPRGVFCFLIVELMVSMKWEPARKESYVNLMTLFKKDTAHYVTLIDRIFCLEVHVKYKKGGSIHDEVREIIDMALYRISNKLKICSNLCYGFSCRCEFIEKMHISYLREDNDKFCCCIENSSTDLTESHTVWLKSYYSKKLIKTEGKSLPMHKSSCTPEAAAATATTLPYTSTHHEIFNKKPEMFDLTKIVIPKIMTKWEYVAEALRYDLATIRTIKEKQREDSKQCCREFFIDWLTTNNGAKAGPKVWSTLLDTLKEVDEIADDITEDIIEKIKQLK